MKHIARKTLALILALSMFVCLGISAQAVQVEDPEALDIVLDAAEGKIATYTVSAKVYEYGTVAYLVEEHPDELADLEFLCVLDSDLIATLDTIDGYELYYDEDLMTLVEEPELNGREVAMTFMLADGVTADEVLHSTFEVTAKLKIDYLPDTVKSVGKIYLVYGGENVLIAYGEGTYKNQSSGGGSEGTPVTPGKQEPSTKTYQINPADIVNGEYTMSGTFKVGDTFIVTGFSGLLTLRLKVPGATNKTVIGLVKSAANGTGNLASTVAADVEVIPMTARTDDGLKVLVDGPCTLTILVNDMSSKFVDIVGTPYVDSIDFVSARTLMNGVSGTSFDPNGTFTRGMVATVLYRLFRSPEASFAKIFDDVNAGDWFATAVTWASQNGIVNGYGADFGPNDAITHEQLVTMLWRIAGEPAAPHTEIGASAWADEAMDWAASVGLGNGLENVSAPQSVITRGEVCCVLQNFINL